ncbi:MAG: flagellar biosynthetic protein FliO [Desulfovibrionaceae bacterium]|nr:flagellar biosynthetic protein FliO [Desulfovibrionaceae bacterium]
MPRALCSAVAASLLSAALVLLYAGPVPAAGNLPGAQQQTAMPQAAESTPAAAPPLPAIAPPAAPTKVTPASAQNSGSSLPLPEVTLSWRGYFEALAILCFLLFGFFSLLWLLKRFSRGGLRFGAAGPDLRIESRLALGPKKWVMAVRYLDKRLLLGVTEQNITLLAEMPLPADPDKEQADTEGNAFPG